MIRRRLLRAAGIGLGAARWMNVRGGYEETDRRETDRSPDELVADMTLDEKVERVHREA